MNFVGPENILIKSHPLLEKGRGKSKTVATCIGFSVSLRSVDKGLLFLPGYFVKRPAENPKQTNERYMYF